MSPMEFRKQRRELRRAFVSEVEPAEVALLNCMYYR